MAEDNIDTLRRDDIVSNDKNELAPENILNSEDVLNDPKILNFGFQGLNRWSQSGKFTIGRSWFKMESNIKICSMSRFDIFCHLYFMKYIKDVFVPEAIKYLKSPVVLGEYLREIGFHLTMACYVSHSVRDIIFKGYHYTQKRHPHMPQSHHIW